MTAPNVLVTRAGPPGRSIELRVSGGQIQWRVTGDASWTDLIATEELVGETGAGVELRATASKIQWRAIGEVSWIDIVALADLLGPPNTLTIGSVTTGSAGSSASANITGTAPNQTLNLTIPRGDPGPVGGGDIIGPASSTDNHVALYSGSTGKALKDGGALGSAAFADTSSFAPTSHTHPASQISDASPNGRSLITAANYAAMKTLLALVKGDVGLGNVDNTSDANKPVSTAQAAAIASSPGLALLSTQTIASAVASVAITAGITSAYDEYEIHLEDLAPSSGAVTLNLTYSADGSSYVGSCRFGYALGASDSSTILTINNNGASAIALSGINNVAGAVNGVIRLQKPSAAQGHVFDVRVNYLNSTPAFVYVCGSARETTAAAITALKFAFSSGNIASGKIRLYGVKTS
ncbi:hypothetical protein ABEG18_12950 [Alsobacter sp. KACC 23698]|uniref:Uncharacterized protein n=1 Tax=Alsobacter sp. KACC 23698 TaxID=3149229 RepID=A0AAU7JN11_9HYPH